MRRHDGRACGRRATLRDAHVGRASSAEAAGSNLTGVADLADYLELTVGQAREQFRALTARRPVPSGRQVTFRPLATLLCLAAPFPVSPRRFGGDTAHQAPSPL